MCFNGNPLVLLFVLERWDLTDRGEPLFSPAVQIRVQLALNENFNKWVLRLSILGSGA